MNINERRRLLMPIIAEALWNSEAEEEQGRRESSSYGVDDGVRTWDDLEDFERKALTNQQTSAAIGVARAGWQPPPRVLEGDWETVRDALDALPEGAQIRWRTGIVEYLALAIRRGEYWAITGYSGPLTSESIARDETPIEVIA